MVGRLLAGNRQKVQRTPLKRLNRLDFAQIGEINAQEIDSVYRELMTRLRFEKIFNVLITKDQS